MFALDDADIDEIFGNLPLFVIVSDGLIFLTSMEFHHEKMTKPKCTVCPYLRRE
jgi:hypothetical protein